jgi:hypothetical protein
MLSAIHKSAAIGAMALAMTGSGGWAAASTAPVPATKDTAVSTAMSQATGTPRFNKAAEGTPGRSVTPLSCTWNPANNADVEGQVDAYDYPAYDSGPGCGYEGYLNPGDPVIVRCGTQVGGVWWDYVTGLYPSPGGNYWVVDSALSYPPAHLHC